MSTDPLQVLLADFQKSVSGNTFVRLTLSKPTAAAPEELRNVYVRPVTLKAGPRLAFNHRYANRDEVKNRTLEEATVLLREWLGDVFLNAQLVTTDGDLHLLIQPGGSAKLRRLPPSQVQPPSTAHDREKHRLISPASLWLLHLGITNKKGEVLPSAQDKWKQINKYLEIMEGLIRQHPLPADVHVADMGSGKGYLTFALYDYLRHTLGWAPRIAGVELRPQLVEFCNRVARECGFDGLHFVAQDIAKYQAPRIDILIALHACDTATDLAIAQGVRAGASVVVVAPCCHKQVRKAMHTRNELSPLMAHGILEERQAELITDGIRALLLESEGYATKVFEFVSTEHTAKNVMITATKRNKMPVGKRENALAQVAALKQGFGVEAHYLEGLLGDSNSH
ncbi:MAG: SAM-dependent methyltransferase [Saprospiraceae bacterium]|nr:SAM-dependent methyltransferase [Saprospiraceae bacterium]